MDQEMRKAIILDNYEHPFHKGLINDDDYILVNANSDTCIDEINLMVKIVDNKIVDAYFDGEACAICTSSTSLMVNKIIGKTLEEAISIYNNFKNMINEEEYDENILEELTIYDNIAKQPNRKKCALLPWMGFEKVIGQEKK